MGTGASTAARAPDESFLVVSTRLYYVDGTFAWRSAEVLQGGKVVKYVQGRDNDAGYTEPAATEFVKSGRNSLALADDESRIEKEVNLTPVQTQELLAFLNQSDALVPDAPAKSNTPRANNKNSGTSSSESLEPPSQTTDILEEDQVPLSDLPSAENYVSLNIAGQFNGPAYCCMVSGICDRDSAAYTDQYEAVSKLHEARKKPGLSPRALLFQREHVRPVFRKQKSDRGRVLRKDVNSWLESEAQRASKAFHRVLVDPIVQCGNAAGTAAGTVGNAAGSAAGAVGNAAGRGAGAVGNAAGSAAGAVGNVAGRGVGAVGSAAGRGAGAVGNAAGSAAGAVANKANAVGAVVSNGNKAVGDRINSGVRKVAESRPVAAIGKGANAVSNGVNDMGEAFVRGVDKLDASADAAFNSVASGAGVVGSQIGNVGKGIGEGANKVASGVAKVGLSVSEAAGRMKNRFGQAMNAMTDSAHSSLDRLWATSEEERARARNALGGLMGKIQRRQAAEQVKFQIEREASQKDMLAILTAEEKAEIGVIDEELEAKLAALKAADAEKKEAQDIRAQVDALKSEAEKAREYVSIRQHQERAKQLNRIKQRQEQRLAQLLKQQEVEAKKELDTFLVSEACKKHANDVVAGSDLVEQQKQQLASLDARLLEEEFAIMEGHQNTEEGKMSSEVHKEYEVALQRSGDEVNAKREAAKLRIQERRAELVQKQQKEIEAARLAEEQLIAKKFEEEQEMIKTAQLQKGAIQRVAAALYLLDLVEGYTNAQPTDPNLKAEAADAELSPSEEDKGKLLPEALPAPVVANAK